jgi:hypothetical protein
MAGNGLFDSHEGQNIYGGIRAGIVLAKAQRRWPFLTSLDAARISNQAQLVSFIEARTGRSRADVEADVRDWMIAKRF